MEISKIFGLIASQMSEELELIKLQPEQLRGRAREVLIRRFLEPFLPDSLGVGSGVITSVSGESSGEIDVIIYDKSAYNMFKPFTYYMPETARPFPAEVVYGVVEVEYDLNKDALHRCVEKILGAKKLGKVAYFEQTGIHKYTNFYGKQWEYFPTFGILFAFHSKPLKELRGDLEQFYTEKNLSMELQTDRISVLNRGIITYYDSDKDLIEFAPRPGLKLMCGEMTPEENLSILFRVMMHMLSQAWIRPIRVFDYLGTKVIWKRID